MARLVRGHAVTALENVALWHERDISHSSAERVILPDAFLALDYMLDMLTGSRRTSSSARSACSATSTRATGCSTRQRLLLALVDAGLARDEAYRLVQAHAMRAWEEERDFTALAREDQGIAKHLTSARWTPSSTRFVHPPCGCDL